MAWLYLVFAGFFEVVWAVGLKSTHGFTRPWPTFWVFATMGVSIWLLSLATRTLPIGTAYAVWTGIGACGAAILGIALFAEPFTIGRSLCLLLIVGGIVGLKLLSPT